MLRLFWLAPIAFVISCGGGLELPDLLPVEGGVSLGGKPLTAGSVSFRADGNGADPKYSPTGAIAASGRYKLFVHGRPGCPAGTYRVVVFANEPTPQRSAAGNAGLPKSIIESKYNDPRTTPFRVEVRADTAPSDYDLKLD